VARRSNLGTDCSDWMSFNRTYSTGPTDSLSNRAAEDPPCTLGLAAVITLQRVPGPEFDCVYGHHPGLRFVVRALARTPLEDGLVDFTALPYP
jgi:hypothetical protein